MIAPVVTGLVGSGAIALGAALRFAIGRARFRRRNPCGVMVFRSYGDWLAIRTTTAVLGRIGSFLLFCGAVLLLSALNAPAGTWQATPGTTPWHRKAVLHD